MGCVFYLSQVIVIDSGGSTYSAISCGNGGIYYAISSSLTVSGASFSNIVSTGNGGLLYASNSPSASTSYTRTYYTFDTCTFSKFTVSDAGGLIYDTASCPSTPLSQRAITNSVISEIYTFTGSVMWYISAEYCTFLLKSTTITAA